MNADDTEHRTASVEEYALSTAQAGAIQELLQLCFPGTYPERPYYKQLPRTRHLVWRGQELVAHLALEHRVIRVGDDPRRILGIVDLCVRPASRGRGLAGALLQGVSNLAGEHGIDCLVLFADDHRLYRRHGFAAVPNDCRWLAIDEHRSLDVRERALPDCFMIKSLSARPWDPTAPVDLLGYLF